VLRLWAATLIRCDIDQKKNMTRCARTGEEEWTMRGSSGAYDVAEIDDERPRVCGTPAKNVDSLAASQATGGEGKGRGGRGDLIGAERG
jgi:hypothetical protein